MTALLKRNDTIPPLLKLAALGVGGGILGYGVGWAFAGQIDVLPLRNLRWSDVMGLIVAALLAVSGVTVLAASRNGRALAAATKSERPAAPMELKDMRIQGAVLILSGLLLAAPAAAALAGNPAPIATLAAIGAVYVVHGLVNLSLWRRGDEMVRRVIVEAGASTFWIGQAVLFAWAAAERLDVAPSLTAWDILVVLMGLYLVCSAVAGLRRGLS